MSRNIQDILDLRRDVSPFLIHLTRSYHAPNGSLSAAEVLKKILDDQQLIGRSCWNDLRHAGSKPDDAFERRFLMFASFSETPLDEMHCLLDIAGRLINLEPYGIVFIKKEAAARGVSPALYLNNLDGDKDRVARDLLNLAKTPDLADLAENILPFVTFFGKGIKAQGKWSRGPSDWRWEREWRYPANQGPFTFNIATDVFAGLCPDDEIASFEATFPPLPFVDPRRPMRWYSTKLMARRRTMGMSEAVV